MFQTIRMLTGKSEVNKLLAKHFQGIELTTLVTAARSFPSAARVDVQFARNDFVITSGLQSGREVNCRVRRVATRTLTQ